MNEPYQQRVVEEHAELVKKLTGLRKFIADTDVFQKVDRDERRRMIRQEVVMTEYADVLDERIKAFTTDFPLGKACDLSGEGTCEACQ
jgi:hypothetical protein